MTALEQKGHVAKVLVVENDEPTLMLLCDHLTADRFQVTGARSIDEATSHLEAGGFDMLLLDLNSGGGLDTLRTIRASENESVRNVGVILISGRDTERDRIRGLGEGADDYILRPFSYGELLARMNAVLRRRRGPVKSLKVGEHELEIDQADRRVKVNGRDVRLSAKEFSLLNVLALEPAKAHSKEELLEAVWGYRSAGHTRTLEAHMSRLRRKLDPDHGRICPNLWGVAYRLNP